MGMVRMRDKTNEGRQTYVQAMKDAEQDYLLRVMNEAGCNKSKAAELSGLHYDTFCRKLAALNVRLKAVIEDR